MIEAKPEQGKPATPRGVSRHTFRITLLPSRLLAYTTFPYIAEYAKLCSRRVLSRITYGGTTHGIAIDPKHDGSTAISGSLTEPDDNGLEIPEPAGKLPLSEEEPNPLCQSNQPTKADEGMIGLLSAQVYGWKLATA
ncbi:uncharacterized protein CLUP02_00773 [Colletotrichum lupini]|uniref:Uncharacterized protein n=1 Tax=Colletotrichum lupini TaxID=145971 RepID=A0A9Q8SC07_9PEZI|nr:uncharacterized protein CLUP02_00773 [Colletotrichum lupini]UQC74126.1 hypothetical protein CLUP02_00773 [Colletotrichum lupini]